MAQGQTTPALTYQGRILDPSGDPVEAASVQFRIDIRSPAPSDCRLYQEIRSVPMANSNGFFKINLNDGSGSITAGSLTLDRALSNRTMVNVSPTLCGDGTGVYTPAANDNRKLNVFFNDGSGWESMPAIAMNYAPTAIESLQVGGFRAAHLLRVQNIAGPTGVPENIDPLTKAQYDELMLLLAGTSLEYTHANELMGESLPALSSGESIYWNGAGWTAYTALTTEADPSVEDFAKDPLPTCAAGHFLRHDGTGQLECVDAAGGGSISIATGTGLTGGPITGTGTIELETIGAGGTGTKVTYDVHGRVTATGALLEGDLPNITSAGKVSGAAITSGEIAGSTNINTSGNITTTGEVYADSLNTLSLILRDTGMNTITLEAPTLSSGSYVLVMPDTNGNAGQLLSTDGDGILSWVDPADTTGVVISVGATAPLTNTGTTTEPVIAINDASTSAKGAVQLATSSDTTAGLVVQADDTRLTDSRAPSGTASGDLGGSYPNPTVEGLDGVALLIGTLTSGNFLKYDGTNWVNAAPAVVDISGLSTALDDKLDTSVLAACNADETLTFVSPSASWTCAPIAIAHTQVSGLGTAATVNTGTSSGNVPVLDGSGKLDAGVLPASVLTSESDPSVEAHGKAAMPGTNCTASEKLAWNGTAWSCVADLGLTSESDPKVGTLTNTKWCTSDGSQVVCDTDAPVSGTGDVLIGGNTVASTMTIGTNSNHALEFETNGTTKMAVLANGNVGIGTTTPTSRLHVTGTNTVGNAGLEAGSRFFERYSLASTGNKTALATTGVADIPSGSTNVIGIMSFASSTGSNAGTVNDATAIWARVDHNGGTMTNAYGLLVSDGGGALSPVNQYGVYIAEQTKGGAQNFGLYTGGTAKSYFGGNVGIGTTSPARLLHVEGPMRLTASTVPSTPALGDIYVDSGDNKLKYHDGTDWVEAGGGSGGGGTVTSVTASGVLASSGGNTPDISLNLGNGLTTVSSSLTMNLGNGLEFDSGAVKAKAGAGITVDGSGINADIGTAAGQVMGADAVPNCDADEKLQMSLGPTFAWSCVADLGITTETDPKVGTLTNTKWCTSNGTQVICNSDAPSGGTGDVLIGGNTVGSTMTIGTNSNHALEFETNGTTKMTVLANGNVGIGTTSPGSFLHVNAGATSNNTVLEGLRLSREDTDSAAASGAGVALTFSVETTTNNTFREAARIEGVWDDATNNSKDGSLRFFTMGPNAASGTTTTTERVRINSSGNMGVNVSSPSERLDVDGAIKIGTTSSTNAGTIRWTGAAFEGYNGSAWQSLGPSTPSGGALCDTTQTFSSAGTHSYTVPAAFGVVTVRVWGGGGGGGGTDACATATSGGTGGGSSVTSLGLFASGGAGGGGSGSSAVEGVGGAGGSASGGAINTQGISGTSGYPSTRGGDGGSAPNGGTGGTGGSGVGPAGSAPGGGGAGGFNNDCAKNSEGGGGGSGGYVEKSYTSAELTPGMLISDVVVGAGGAAGTGYRAGGAGGIGRISIACSSVGAPPQNDRAIVFMDGANHSNVTDFVYSSDGHVGIGTASPARPLHVEGPMRLTASTVPSTPALGDIYVDSGDNKLKYHDGTDWVEAGGGSGGGGGGTVTDVTASGVLASSGGNTPDISLNLGNGLTTISSSLTMNLGNGLEFDSGAVKAKAGAGITVDGSGINADIGTAAGQVMGADAVPNCAADEKLQMSLGPTFAWTCVADLGLTSESDPKVGTLTNTKWCTSDGTQVICNSDLPASGTGDVTIGGNTVASTMVVGTNSNHALGLETNGTTKMTILANGNVGIGTASPAFRFHVVNDMAIESFGGGNSGLVQRRALGTQTVPTQLLAGERMGGWYGAGYTDSGWSSTNSTAIQFIATEDMTSTAQGSRMIFETTPNGSNSRQTRMAIHQNGNVGIGTTTPADKLSLQGSDEDLRLRIMNVSSTTTRYPGVFVANVMGAGNHNGAPTFSGVQTRGTAGATAPVQNGDHLFQLSGSGVYNAAWDSRPNAQITMMATETHSGSAGGAAISFRTVANGQTNLTSRMHIDHDGKVGIGTTSPLFTFHVRPGVDQNLMTASSTHWSGVDGVSIASVDDANSAYKNINFAAKDIVLNAAPGTGNVGIGNHYPYAPLDVASHGGQSFPLILRHGNYGGTGWSLGPYHSYNHFFIVDEGSQGMYLTKGSGATGWSVNSDQRLKENIQTINDQQALEALLQLSPVTYRWKDKRASSEQQIGLIAQDVQKVFPHLVAVSKDNHLLLKDGSEEDVPQTLGVNYTGLVMPLINAVKELYHKWMKHDAQLETQSLELASIKDQLSQLEMDKLKKEQVIEDLKKANLEKEKQLNEMKKRLDRIEKMQTRSR